MFNFLVSYVGWTPPSNVIDLSRVLEYTAAHVVERFKPDGELDLDAMLKLPTLFMTEINGSGPAEARIGRITKATKGRTGVDLRFDFDSSLPRLSNRVVEQLARELQIDDAWELKRSHWAIKEVDLFETMLRHRLGDRPTPRIFGVADPGPIEEDLVSVMMPYPPAFDGVFATLKEATGAMGLRCERAKDIWINDAVIADIYSLIHRSSVVVCDCTGKNSNVLYETGIAHTLGRNVIPITQTLAPGERLPFDTNHIRHVIYKNTLEGLRELAQQIGGRLKTLLTRTD